MDFMEDLFENFGCKRRHRGKDWQNHHGHGHHDSDRYDHDQYGEERTSTANMIMISCSNCMERIPMSYRFCPNCGTALPTRSVLCLSCKSEVPPHAKFCPSCGNKRT